MKWVIKVGNNGFLSKGSYQFRGERFVLLSDIKNARVFASRKLAEARIEAIKDGYANIQKDELKIIEADEKEDIKNADKN